MALRQRKGKTEATNEEAPKQSKEDVVQIFQDKMHAAMESKVRDDNPDLSQSELNQKVDDCLKESLSKIFQPKKAPLPGIKHATKFAKDDLAEDPYNLQLIFALGEGYIKEEKFSQAANVLIRGWKRVSEIKGFEARFLFLMRLCHASNECGMYRQAEAVFMDIEMDVLPEDVAFRMDYYRMATKVYANNKNLPKALNAFNKGLENCKSVQDAMPLWFDTLNPLKMVGAYDAAKSAIEQLASTDEDRQKLHVTETFCNMRAGINASANKPVLPRKVKFGFVAVLACVIVYLLYLLESRSLKQLAK